MRIPSTSVLLVGISESLLREVANEAQCPLHVFTPLNFQTSSFSEDLPLRTTLAHAFGVREETRLIVFMNIHQFTTEQKLMLKELLTLRSNSQDNQQLWGMIPAGAFIGEDLGFVRVVSPQEI